MIYSGLPKKRNKKKRLHYDARPVYLASDSKARRRLFKLFGLKFKVLVSDIKERKKPQGSASFVSLVKHNALMKAQDVANRVKGGIVIAADTIVVQGKQIFGKPKNLSQAHKMLKLLCQKPQWIYTGLAVIDKDRRITKTSYEKTKVYMDKLTDREIADYFACVSPLDKAGSFDIQGKGAFFIRRIEGCFYTVVGIPLRKLYRTLKELGVMVFTLFLLLLPAVFLSSGCSTEYNLVTGKEESYYYSTDREVLLGRSLAKEIEKKYKLVDDPLVQKRVADIGQKIAGVCDRKDIDYQFKALNDDEINAVSLPGGSVYVFKGLIDKVSSDDELAAVLAHEVGHIVARHSVKKLQALMGYNLLRVLASQVPHSGEIGGTADLAFTEIFLGYSREDELLADQLGTRYVKLAGFKPHAMISFLKKLQEVNRRKPLTPRSYFKTHPYVPDRIRVVKQELGENIDFTDYINIEDKKHE